MADGYTSQREVKVMTRQAAEAERLREQKRIAGMFHRVFDGSDGADLLEWFSIECMEHSMTLSVGHPDVSAFNEGKRAVILRIRAVLGVKL